MDPAYIIGVDIGGTNTDAVLVDRCNRIVDAVKTPTTEEISAGFTAALKRLLSQSSILPDQVQMVSIGTTHATNAILQYKDLFRVGVIRLAGQRPQALPAAYAWPRDLKDALIGGVETVGGGFECYGAPLTPLCENELRQAIRRLFDKGVESLAIIGVFSPLNGQQEKRACCLAREIAGDSFPVSLSCEIGGIGFIERENSTILNASLKCVMRKGFSSLQAACRSLQLACPLRVSQNDGSLIEVERAIDYPVLTISAGPTNSFIGGIRLAGLESGIVVDIGGTSTDVGVVRRGFPVRSLNKSEIGGVSLNFPMPDVLSIALGGGSIVRFRSSQAEIGPDSVGKGLCSQALSFGGSTLTLTDAALAMGTMTIAEAQPQRAQLTFEQSRGIFTHVKEKLADLILKIRGEERDLPIVFVGGGSALLPEGFLPEACQIPRFFDVANAYGAALAEISGTVDTVVSLRDRNEVLEELYEEAKQAAILQGAQAETLRLVDQQIIPYSYVPNQMARVIVRVCGKRAAAKLV